MLSLGITESGGAAEAATIIYNNQAGASRHLAPHFSHTLH